MPGSDWGPQFCLAIPHGDPASPHPCRFVGRPGDYVYIFRSFRMEEVRGLCSHPFFCAQQVTGQTGTPGPASTSSCLQWALGGGPRKESPRNPTLSSQVPGPEPFASGGEESCELDSQFIVVFHTKGAPGDPRTTESGSDWCCLVLTPQPPDCSGSVSPKYLLDCLRIPLLMGNRGVGLQ